MKQLLSLDAPKPQLVFKKACLELKGVTTEELVALQAQGEGDVSAIYNCVLTDASYDLETLHGRYHCYTSTWCVVSDQGSDWRSSKGGGCVPLPCVIKSLGQYTGKAINT